MEIGTDEYQGVLTRPAAVDGDDLEFAPDFHADTGREDKLEAGAEVISDLGKVILVVSRPFVAAQSDSPV